MSLEKKPLPSRSLPPGPARLWAMLTMDPAAWVFGLVVAIVEGIVRGLRSRRRDERPESEPPQPENENGKDPERPFPRDELTPPRGTPVKGRRRR